MNNKIFDCIEIKRQYAAEVCLIIKNMSIEQELAYWQEKTKKYFFAKEQKQIPESGLTRLED